MEYNEYLKLYNDNINLDIKEFNEYVNKFKNIQIKNNYEKLINKFNKYIIIDNMYMNIGMYNYYTNLIYLDTSVYLNKNSLLYYFTLFHEIGHKLGYTKYIKYIPYANIFILPIKGYRRCKEELISNLFSYMVINNHYQDVKECLTFIVNWNNKTFGKIKNKKDYDKCLNEAERRYNKIEKYLNY